MIVLTPHPIFDFGDLPGQRLRLSTQNEVDSLLQIEGGEGLAR